MFIAIDGEGYTKDDGTHIYNLIAASTGEYLLDEIGSGLRTLDVFNWFYALKGKYPKATFVSFYFAYDVNMILGNVPPSCVNVLAQTGKVYLDDKGDRTKTTRVEYAPVKFFKVSRGYRKGIIGQDMKFVTTDTITIWDVWGFFQGSFVNALKQFKIGTEEELEVIKSMKGAREDFGEVDIQSIIDYNALECKLLCAAMDKLQDALETAGLKLTSWHGAGAVAMAMLKKYDVISHIAPAAGSHQKAVLHAYFGGRIQALQIGEFETVYGHDIISAYPYSTMQCFSMRDCEQVVCARYSGENPNSIWHVTWDLPSDTKICPFPFRLEDGSIIYPYTGEGYYWQCEIKAALEHYKRYITVYEGYIFLPTDERKPFDFIPEVFNQRRRFKEEGNHAQIALKLGLNSLYGKCAQGKGYGGNIPRTQCYVWAGLITAQTRAKVFDLAMSNPDSVIAFSTDGVFANEQLTKEGNNIGEWEVNSYRIFFNLKSGFYRGRRVNGKTIRHVRGFRTREVRFSNLLRVWRIGGILGYVETNNRRFVGMKSAGKKLTNWRKWIDGTKELSFMPVHGDAVCTYDPMDKPKSCPDCMAAPCRRPDCAHKPKNRGLKYRLYGIDQLGLCSKAYDPNDSEFEEKDAVNSEVKLI
jgi:hypothetical protein